LVDNISHIFGAVPHLICSSCCPIAAGSSVSVGLDLPYDWEQGKVISSAQQASWQIVPAYVTGELLKHEQPEQMAERDSSPNKENKFFSLLHIFPLGGDQQHLSENWCRSHSKTGLWRR